MIFLYSCVLSYLVLQNPCGAQRNPPDATLTLSSLPATPYCAGPVNFTCTGVKVRKHLYWHVNHDMVATYNVDTSHQFPRILQNGFSTEVVFYAINAKRHPGENESVFYDVTTTLVVKDVTLLNNTALECSVSDLIDTLNIKVLKRSAPAPPVPFDSCSLRASNKGMDLSLQWSQNFTTQYNVKKYLVSVHPDLPSCPKTHSPNRDYICSGLSLGTRYTFTLGARFNSCSSLNGKTFSVQLNDIEEPQDLELFDSEVFLIAQWKQQSALKSKGACPALFGDISYIVQQLDFRGAMMNQAVVLPDACSDNICKATISPTTCVVQVQTTSNYGSSSLSFLPVDKKPQDLELNIKTLDGVASRVEWRQQGALESEAACLALFEEISYIVEQVDFRGAVVDQRIVHSDNCTDHVCTALILPTTCVVKVQATSSNNTLFNSSFVTTTGTRLTIRNKLQLIVGTNMLGLSIIICIILIVLSARTKQVSKLSMIVLLVGVVLGGLSVVMWTVTGYRVLQMADVCGADRIWELDRSRLIAYSHSASVMTLLVVIVSAVLWALTSDMSCEELSEESEGQNHSLYSQTFH